MKRIAISLSIVAAAVAAVAIGATGAFFSDTETSTGNTFTAGAIDLKVDSKCHYYNIVSFDGNVPVYGADLGCQNNQTDFGTWSETDLQDGVNQFFSFADIKPGDKGEDTISLHVKDNDAWGKITMGLTNNFDNSCTEPEQGTNGEGCTVAIPEGTNPGSGELLGAMLLGFEMWLDQGAIPGFQNTDANGNPVVPKPDPTEGDNIRQANDEPSINVQGTTKLSDVLAAAWSNACDENEFNPNGHNGYGTCQGLAEDGRMVGSTTYYLGLAWELPWNTGNEVQTDSLGGDITFNVVQYRNNPTQLGL